MLAKDMEYVVFDVETTGLSPMRGDRIIEIGAIKTKNNQVVDTLESFINPERLIPLEAQRVNNISDDMVKDAPCAGDILPQMIDFIGGACLVGHNLKFDLDFLCFELAQLGRKLNDQTLEKNFKKILRMSCRFMVLKIFSFKLNTKEIP